jgi:hypothetical protein
LYMASAPRLTGPKVPRQARPGDGVRRPDACCRSDCLQWSTGERCHAPELVPLSSLGTFFFISLGAPMRVCTVETPDDFGGFLVHESVGGLVGDWLGPARIRRRSRLAAWLRWLRGCGGCVVVWFGSSCAGQDLSAGFSVGFDSRPLAPSLHHRPPTLPIPSCPSRQSANCILHPANTIIAPAANGLALIDMSTEKVACASPCGHEPAAGFPVEGCPVLR